MIKKIIITIVLIALVLGISYVLIFFSLISNTRKYNSSLEIDKETNTLYATSEEIKILQLSDIQIDNLTEAITPFNIVKEIIAKTKPDLIVLTGDNLGNSGGKKEITKLAKFMDSFEIPWAPVYGNHDYWASVSIKKQNKVFEDSKYCLFKTGTVENSNGNYCYTIKRNNEAIYSLMFMDSMEEGFIPAHLTWYEETIKQINEENNKIVSNMMFSHIPIPELGLAYNEFQKNPSIGSGVVGEPLSLQKENVGIYSKAKELGSTKLFAFGHDHINTLQIKYEDIVFSYGIKTGLTSYYDESIQGGCLYTIKKDSTFEIERIIT